MPHVITTIEAIAEIKAEAEEDEMTGTYRRMG